MLTSFVSLDIVIVIVNNLYLYRLWLGLRLSNIRHNWSCYYVISYMKDYHCECVSASSVVTTSV